MEAPRPSILAGYRSGLRGVVGASATAYGYTLWATAVVLAGSSLPGWTIHRKSMSSVEEAGVGSSCFPVSRR